MDRSTPQVILPVTVYVSRIPRDLGLKDSEIHDVLDDICKQFGAIKYDFVS
jgi:hypothetical protein